MNCKNHNHLEASYYCSYCGQPLCPECTVEVNNKSYCKECLEKSIEMNKNTFKPVSRPKKSKFLTFIFSIVPGAGHMYLGLLNSGLSIMVLFFGLIFALEFIHNIIFLNSYWGEGYLIAIGVIFISYSIFDSLDKAGDINSGIILNDSKGFDFSKGFGFVAGNIQKRKNIIGYALIILGCLNILNIFSRTVGQVLVRYMNISFPFTITDIFVAAILIGLGIFFIKKGKNTGM